MFWICLSRRPSMTVGCRGRTSDGRGRIDIVPSGGVDPCWLARGLNCSSTAGTERELEGKGESHHIQLNTTSFLALGVWFLLHGVPLMQARDES